MKIGKYELPIYFNREFFKFNPILFLIKEYDHTIFWVAMPIIGLIFKFVGGLFDWAGDNGALGGGSSGIIVEGFLNFLRSKTWLDKTFEDMIMFLFNGILNIEKGSGLELFGSYVFWSFLWYVKFFIIYYILAKISLVFFSSKEDITFNGVVKNKTYQFGKTKSRESLDETINDTWELIQLLKRC